VAAKSFSVGLRNAGRPSAGTVILFLAGQDATLDRSSRIRVQWIGAPGRDRNGRLTCGGSPPDDESARTSGRFPVCVVSRAVRRTRALIGRVSGEGGSYTRGASTPKDELRDLVEQLSDDQVPAVVADLRSRLAPVRAQRSWPPAWFGIVVGSADDLSERVEEILAEDLGQRPA